MKKKGGEVARELLIKIGTEEDEILQKLLKSKKEFKHNQDSLLMEALRFYYHNQQKQSGKITNEIDSKQKFFKPDNATFISYLSRQIKTPYESTKSFFSFLDSIEDLKKSSIIDACCGGGGNLFFLKKNFTCQKLYGFDLENDFLEMAKQSAKELGMVDISFINADIYNLPHSILNQRVDGVICLQTLSWLGDWRKALEQLAKTNSKWIALSSLFYDGLLQANTCIINYDEDLKVKHRVPYNVYSIPVVKNFLDKLGFTDIIFNPFQINLDLPRGDLNRVGTFTEKLEDGRRLQFSGPIVLPWYFLFARRKAAP